MYASMYVWMYVCKYVCIYMSIRMYWRLQFTFSGVDTLLSRLISAPFFITAKTTLLWTLSSTILFSQRTWSIEAPYIHDQIMPALFYAYIGMIWSNIIVFSSNRHRVQERQLVQGGIRRRVHGCDEALHGPGRSHIVQLQFHQQVKQNRWSIRTNVRIDNFD